VEAATGPRLHRGSVVRCRRHCARPGLQSRRGRAGAGTGVAIRLATEAEAGAIERARPGANLIPVPVGSYRYAEPDRSLEDGEAYVVSQAFVEFVDGQANQRWVSYERFGERVSLVEDATRDLLGLAQETWAEDLSDLLADMRQAGLGTTRWEPASAPRRIELAPGLEELLAPLRQR
jgi:hypothetical protein